MKYDDLLKRAREDLPDTIFKQTRFEIPRVSSNIEGNKTFLTNIREILDIINRDGNHFLKYLAGELATAVTMEGNRAVFAGKHARLTLQKLLEKYIEEYVFCNECGKPDTKLISEDRMMKKRCAACGAKIAVKPLRR